MRDHTFVVQGPSCGGGQGPRPAADGAFSVPGVLTVGIDGTVATLTIPGTGPTDVAERITAQNDAGFGPAHGQPAQHRVAS